MTTSYLTIDDAPSEALPEKLAILESHDVPAVFFCEGSRLEAYPDHARQAVEAGFHLGNHAYSHQHASELSTETLRDEIERTETLLEDVYYDAGVSRPARMFRFPYGDKGDERREEFQEVLEEWGFTPPDPTRLSDDWYGERNASDRDWFWTVSVEDWTVESRSELRERIEAAAERLTDPSDDVILFHDAGNATALFEDFVELLVERGTEFGDPIDLLNRA